MFSLRRSGTRDRIRGEAVALPNHQFLARIIQYTGRGDFVNPTANHDSRLYGALLTVFIFDLSSAGSESLEPPAINLFRRGRLRAKRLVPTIRDGLHGPVFARSIGYSMDNRLSKTRHSEGPSEWFYACIF